jgi:multidrug resistance efflux pump
MRTAILVLLCAPLLYAQQPLPVPEATPAPAQEPPVPYARVLPLRSLVVRSRIDATVARLFVQVGEQVKGMAQLVMLSAPDLNTDVGRAEQEQFTAEKELEAVAAEERIATVRVAIAQRKVKFCEQAIPDRKMAAESAATLLESFKGNGRFSPREVDEMQQAMLQRSAALREAEAALVDAKDEQKIAEQTVERADALVKVQRSRIDAARAAREVLKVRADMADVKNLLPGARVTRLFVSQHDLVSPGAPILELTDDSRVLLQIYVPANLAGRVRAGTMLALRAQDGAPADLQVKVLRVSGVLDPESQTMLAETEVDNPDGKWLCGLQLPVAIVEGGSR